MAAVTVHLFLLCVTIQAIVPSDSSCWIRLLLPSALREVKVVTMQVLLYNTTHHKEYVAVQKVKLFSAVCWGCCWTRLVARLAWTW